MRFGKPLIIVAATAFLALLLLHYKERRTYQCPECFSRKHVYQWSAGVWPGFALPLSPRYERLETSNVCLDFYGPDHEHEWHFFQGSSYYLFGTSWGGCALGAARHRNIVVDVYEADPTIRSSILVRMGTGDLDNKTVIDVLHFRDDDTDPDRSERYRAFCQQHLGWPP